MSLVNEDRRHGSKRYAALRAAGADDELRCALMLGRDCWGSLLMYRAGGHFTREEADAIARLGPLLAQIVRFALLRKAADQAANLPEAPGVVAVDAQGHVEVMSEPAKQWLDELDYGQPWSEAVQAIAMDLRNGEKGLAFAFSRGKSGRWIRLHASWLETDRRQKAVVVLEPARPVELAAILGRFYGLTDRERQVTMWSARGLSAKEIARELSISPLTVNDHLKAIFSKVGVQSRQQLIATLFFDHCLPRREQLATPGAYGWFLE